MILACQCAHILDADHSFLSIKVNIAKPKVLIFPQYTIFTFPLISVRCNRMLSSKMSFLIRITTFYVSSTVVRIYSLVLHTEI